MEAIITVLILTTSIPLVVFIYFIILSGWFSIFIARLTKVSFQMTITHTIDLLVAYCFGMIAFIYILYPFIFPDSLAIDKSSMGFISLFDKNMIIFSGIIVLYIGRIVSHQEGSFYGKIHFSSLFIISSLVFLVNVMRLLKDQNLDISSLTSIFNLIYDISKILVELLRQGIYLFSQIYKQFFIGSIIVSTLGEFALCHIETKPRSLIAASEKLPSNLILVNSINNKLDEMFDEKAILLSMKCITKSCTMPAYIKPKIDQEIEKYKTYEGVKGIRPIYKIIRSPFEEVTESFRNRGETSKLKEYLKKYKIVNDLKKDGKIDLIEYNFNDLRMLILKFNNFCEKMLIITTDKGPRQTKVGLYTEEPTAICLFSDIFDRAWEENRNK